MIKNWSSEVTRTTGLRLSLTRRDVHFIHVDEWLHRSKFFFLVQEAALTAARLFLSISLWLLMPHLRHLRLVNLSSRTKSLSLTSYLVSLCVNAAPVLMVPLSLLPMWRVPLSLNSVLISTPSAWTMLVSVLPLCEQCPCLYLCVNGVSSSSLSVWILSLSPALWMMFSSLLPQCEQSPLSRYLYVNGVLIHPSSVCVNSVPASPLWECWLNFFFCVNDAPFFSFLCVHATRVFHSVWMVSSSLLPQCEWCPFVFSFGVNSVPSLFTSVCVLIPSLSVWLMSFFLLPLC